MKFNYLVKSARSTLATQGLGVTVKQSWNYIGHALFPTPPDETIRRFRLGQKLASKFNNTVAYGPFSGLVLSDTSWWGAADKGSMLLGFYEKEVIDTLAAMAPMADTFVDIGAADGYYVVGSVSSGLFSKGVCFEISQEGRKAIHENADRNAVSNQVTIFGEANLEVLIEVINEQAIDMSKSVFLIDIEGAEFTLLSGAFLEAVQKSILIIEIHEWEAPESNGVEELVGRTTKYFDIEWLTMGARDLSIYPELTDWPDDDRWILCSESRQKSMQWLVLRPTSV